MNGRILWEDGASGGKSTTDKSLTQGDSNMALVEGRDYAAGLGITWVFSSGVGKGVAVVTPHQLFVIPYDTIAGAGRAVTNTVSKIGKDSVASAVAGLLTNESATIESVEAQLSEWAQQSGAAIVKPLSSVKRIKLRTGFFTRGVTFSEKEKGFDSGFGTAIGFRPTKLEMAGFLKFFEGDSRCQ